MTFFSWEESFNDGGIGLARWDTCAYWRVKTTNKSSNEFVIDKNNSAMFGSLGNLNILVIDDNVHMCRIVETMLRGFGIKHIETLQDVAGAKIVLKSHCIDIAIVDYLMQPEDGLEFAKYVRTDSESRNDLLPIILMTSYTESWRVTDAKNAGVNIILAKPISPIQLYKRIVFVIENPRQFVRSDNYVGPDRRVDNSEIFDGEERRETQKV